MFIHICVYVFLNKMTITNYTYKKPRNNHSIKINENSNAYKTMKTRNQYDRKKDISIQIVCRILMKCNLSNMETQKYILLKHKKWAHLYKGSHKCNDLTLMCYQN